MSVTKNVFTLKKAYEQIVDGQWSRYDASQDSGEFWVWGRNYRGQLGINSSSYINYSSPVQLPGASWCFADTSYRSSMAVKSDGTLWAWGGGACGLLGIETAATFSSPVQVPGNQWKMASIGCNVSAAVKTDGTLWVMGDNACGGLGINDLTITLVSSPTQIPGTQWCHVNTFIQFGMMAIKNDGTMWGWGLNNCGRLGLNNNIPRSSPTQIPGTQWSVVCPAGSSIAALKTDGTLWSWGDTTSCIGMFPASSSSPNQIPGTQWVKISMPDGFSNPTSPKMALKSDSTLWVWGDFSAGALGLNQSPGVSPFGYNSPVQLGGSWLSMGSGFCSGHAIKTDGTMWAWGLNDSGQLGQNDTICYSSPRQIPGVKWTCVTASAAVIAKKQP